MSLTHTPWAEEVLGKYVFPLGSFRKWWSKGQSHPRDAHDFGAEVSVARRCWKAPGCFSKASSTRSQAPEKQTRLPLAQRPWLTVTSARIEEPAMLQSMGSPRVRCDWTTSKAEQQQRPGGCPAPALRQHVSSRRNRWKVHLDLTALGSALLWTPKASDTPRVDREVESLTRAKTKEACAPSAWGTQVWMAASIPPPGSPLTAQGQQDKCACAFQSPKAQKHWHVRD